MPPRGQLNDPERVAEAMRLYNEIKAMRKPTDIVQWYTYEEAANFCQRSPKYIKEVTNRFKLERKLVRAPGSHNKYWTVLAPESVRFLQVITLGV
jgi:hypothetical protein